MSWRQSLVILGALTLSACGGELSSEDDAPCTALRDTCQGDNICIVGQCEDAHAQEYKITFKKLNAKSTRPDGSDWDEDKSLPELFVRVETGTLNNSACVTRLSSEIDSNEIIFKDTYCPLIFELGDKLSLKIYDEDTLRDELIFQCRGVLDAQTLRTRDFACETEEGKLTFKITPQDE